MGRYPWAVRAGGPLLQGGGGALPTIFDWEPETAEALPATATFTRASVAQVLTTTDGSTFWYQEAKSGELRLDGLRRVENLTVDSDLSTNWAVQNGTNNGPVSVDGRNGSNFTLEATNGFVNQPKSQVIGRIFRITIYARSNAGTQTTSINSFYSGSHHRKAIILTSSVQRFSEVFDATAEATEVLVYAADNRVAGGSATDVDILDVQVELVQDVSSPPSDFILETATFNAEVAGVRYYNTTNGNSVDGNGVVTEATGTTITGGGYLPEAAATNRLLHSNDLTNAAWVAQGAATPTDLGVTDIGGQTTRVSGLGALGVDDIAQSVGGFTASGAVAPSVLLRRNSTTGTLRISSVGGLGNGEWQVDLSLIGPGWVRLEPGATVPGFSEFTPWVADGSGNAGVVYSAVAGGPLTVDLSFNQTENTAFATSPIITSGSTVTRVADSLTDAAWSATAAAVIDTTVNSIVPGGTVDNQQNMLGFGDNTAYAFGISAPSTARIFTGGINSFIVAASSYEGERHGFGMSFQVNEGIVVDDEDNDNTDVTGTPGGGTIQIGLNSALVGVPGLYHRIRIANVTQTVAELKALV